MKRQTADLVGAALDDAVARAHGWIDYLTDSKERGAYWHCEPDRAPFGIKVLKCYIKPSTDWSQGGPIIESERITIRATQPGNAWTAYKTFIGSGRDGPTALVAAMRCYVASKLGDEVDVPEGLPT